MIKHEDYCDCECEYNFKYLKNVSRLIANDVYTFEKISTNAREFADYIDKLKADGWNLRRVDQGNIKLWHSDPTKELPKTDSGYTMEFK